MRLFCGDPTEAQAMPPKPASTSQSEAMLDAALALAKTIGVPNVLVLVERMDRKVFAYRLP